MPGPDPAKTALAEIYLPPEEAYGPRGIDLTTDGVVWTALSSGHMASFDRSKCKGPLNGPRRGNRQACARKAGRSTRMPGPQFKGVTDPGSANHAYYSGSTATTRSASAPTCRSPRPTAASRCSRWSTASSSMSACPIRMGFFTKNVDGRIDDPNGGWKGRGLWTTSGTRTVFHNEGGNAEPAEGLQGAGAPRSAGALRSD